MSVINNDSCIFTKEVEETATDKLRHLLDKHGVEWTAPNSCLRDEETMWVAGGFDYQTFEETDGTFLLMAEHQGNLTPEQVIEATLGRDECRIRDGECDQCGAIIHRHANMYWVPVGDGMRTVKHRDVHYCPNCGRKVIY